MNQYEVMYIIRPNLDEEQSKAVVARFNELIVANKGTVDDVDEWGKRKLAYPIEDETEGVYYLYNFESGSEFPAELQRVLKITDGILRYLVVKKEA